MEHVRTFLFPEAFSNKENRFLFETTGGETPEIPEDDQELDLDSWADEAVQSVDDLYSNLTPEQKRELYERLRTEFETEEEEGTAPTEAEEPPVNEPATAEENGAEPPADESAEGQTDVLTDDLMEEFETYAGDMARSLNAALEMGNVEDAEDARATLEAALNEMIGISLCTPEQASAWVKEQFPTFEGVAFDEGILTMPGVPAGDAAAGEGQKPAEKPAAAPAPMPAPERPAGEGAKNAATAKPTEAPAAGPAPKAAPERPAGEGGGAAKGAEKATELTEEQKKTVERVESHIPMLESEKQNIQIFQSILDQLKDDIKALPKDKADEIKGRLNTILGAGTPPREIKVEQDGSWKVVEKAVGGAKSTQTTEAGKEKVDTLMEQIKQFLKELLEMLRGELKKTREGTRERPSRAAKQRANKDRKEVERRTRAQQTEAKKERQAVQQAEAATAQAQQRVNQAQQQLPPPAQRTSEQTEEVRKLQEELKATKEREEAQRTRADTAEQSAGQLLEELAAERALTEDQAARNAELNMKLEEIKAKYKVEVDMRLNAEYQLVCTQYSHEFFLYVMQEYEAGRMPGARIGREGQPIYIERVDQLTVVQGNQTNVDASSTTEVIGDQNTVGTSTSAAAQVESDSSAQAVGAGVEQSSGEIDVSDITFGEETEEVPEEGTETVTGGGGAGPDEEIVLPS